MAGLRCWEVTRSVSHLDCHFSRSLARLSGQPLLPGSLFSVRRNINQRRRCRGEGLLQVRSGQAVLGFRNPLPPWRDVPGGKVPPLHCRLRARVAKVHAGTTKTHRWAKDGQVSRRPGAASAARPRLRRRKSKACPCMEPLHQVRHRFDGLRGNAGSTGRSLRRLPYHRKWRSSVLDPRGGPRPFDRQGSRPALRTLQPHSRAGKRRPGAPNGSGHLPTSVLRRSR
jgi:hypothetical protein